MFKKSTFRDALGQIVIKAPLSAPVDRLGFEKQFFTGIEVGLAGWHRAHSQGAGTGYESPHAIRYAPQEVNLIFQARVERCLRKLVEEKAADVTLWLTTVTATHPGTLRLKEIQYLVEAVRGEESHRLFEVSIEVANTRINPRVSIRAMVRS